MKILYVTTISNTVNAFLIPHIRMLVREGHKVDVAFNIVQKVNPEIIELGCKVHNVEFQRSPLKKQNYIAYEKIKKIINDEAYDMVHTHTPVASALVRLACRHMQNVRVIYTAHGFHFYKGAPILNWLVFYPIEWVLARYTDLIITINKEDYLIVKKNFKTCDACLLNGVGVDLSKFLIDNKDEIRMSYRKNLNIPYDAKVLIYVAELSRNKNQLMLLRVLKKICETYENVYLVLAGIDQSNGEIQSKAGQLELTKYVRFLGWRGDIANLYVMSDICVASSLREGLPINIIEAMASSIPVVATNNRGHVAIINNDVNGFLVNINDDLAMANNVIKLIDNDNLRIEFIKNAKNDLHKYENKEILSKLKIILYKYCYVGRACRK